MINELYLPVSLTGSKEIHRMAVLQYSDYESLRKVPVPIQVESHNKFSAPKQCVDMHRIKSSLPVHSWKE